MPRYTPSDEEMDSSYGNAPVAPPDAKPDETVDEEETGSNEILVPKSQLPEGCKEGDEYTFRVLKDYGDEASLELVSEPGEETSESEEPMDETASDFAAMSEQEQ